MVEHIGGKKMISEMVETRDRIQNEFYEEFENMSQKFKDIWRPWLKEYPLRMEYTLFRARSELTYPER